MEVLKQLEKLLKAGVIQSSQASEYSQELLVKKPHSDKWRFCIDYRSLNKQIQSMGWPIPNIKRLLQTAGQ